MSWWKLLFCHPSGPFRSALSIRFFLDFLASSFVVTTLSVICQSFRIGKMLASFHAIELASPWKLIIVAKLSNRHSLAVFGRLFDFILELVRVFRTTT